MGITLPGLCREYSDYRLPYNPSFETVYGVAFEQFQNSLNKTVRQDVPNPQILIGMVSMKVAYNGNLGRGMSVLAFTSAYQDERSFFLNLLSTRADR